MPAVPPLLRAGAKAAWLPGKEPSVAGEWTRAAPAPQDRRAPRMGGTRPRSARRRRLGSPREARSRRWSWRLGPGSLTTAWQARRSSRAAPRRRARSHAPASAWCVQLRPRQLPCRARGWAACSRADTHEQSCAPERLGQSLRPSVHCATLRSRIGCASRTRAAFTRHTSSHVAPEPRRADGMPRTPRS